VAQFKLAAGSSESPASVEPRDTAKNVIPLKPKAKTKPAPVSVRVATGIGGGFEEF